MTEAKAGPNPSASEIIAMAWDDETSFDAIERATGLSEKDVIKLMRAELKPSSFRTWRARVSGRKAKHDKRLR
ncbi:MAG: TIGR03643 family protein [Pseudomonadota bacterium]